MQAALSKYELNDFVNDRYDKIENNLQVCLGLGWGLSLVQVFSLPCASPATLIAH